MKKPEVIRGLASRSSTSVPLLDDPPLGHLQAIILKKLDELGRDAFGYKVLEQLSEYTGVWIDHSQIYASIRKLINHKYMVLLEERKSQDGGPPFKVYKLTPEGRAALKSTAEHHTAVAQFLSGKR